MKSLSILKYKVQIFSFLFVFFIVNKLSYLYHESDAGTVGGKIVDSIAELSEIFSPPLISLDAKDIFIGIIFSLFVQLYLYTKKKNKKTVRKDQEYGSAMWATEKDGNNYKDSNFRNNIILTATEGITLKKAKSFSYERNKNVLVVGGSGSGKTRFFLKPNLMQMHSSYVITDPKGLTF